MNISVLRAVFFRNFTSYFTNPTGYLFIFVFVALSTIVGFWRPEFFSDNLASLHLLNPYCPWIMLVFVPAITMGIWADERRQGTDELLLTVPATDFDIVLGKYLAAVTIFTASLLFSMICNFCMLWWLSEGWLSGGGPDWGLFLGTYAGYWLVGLTMLATGMVASFLTSNLTVGYVLGTLLNVPLAVAVFADQLSGAAFLSTIGDFSIGGQLYDFGRGIISFSGIVYFVAIAMVMLYLSMVLIGRRHWTSKQRGPMILHYLARAVSLLVVVMGLTAFFTWYDVRADVTAERLSTLSPKTEKLLDELEVKQAVQIDAFISKEVPETFVQTKANLEMVLREFDRLGGNKIQLQLFETEMYSQEASQASEEYGITPQPIQYMERGTLSRDEIFMHVAVSCGLQTIEPVYFNRGIPPEYELLRSVLTVSQQKRKRIGIVNTDARLYGQFNMQMMSRGSDWPIVSELQKQYDVEQVDLTNPIGEGEDEEPFDALLAVQPSSLGPAQMENFIAAIRSGIPTAIFEDPCPLFVYGQVPATSEDRRPPQAMNPMMGRQPPPPKCRPQLLFDALGIRIEDTQVVFQEYNPYPKMKMFDERPEYVFIAQGAVSDTADDDEEDQAAKKDRLARVFNQKSGATANLEQVLFPCPGFVSKIPSMSTSLEISELVRTGTDTGTVEHGMGPDQALRMVRMQMVDLNPMRARDYTGDEYVLAVHIRGKKEESAKKKNQGNDEDAGPNLDGDEASSEKINVIFVADVDLLTPGIFYLREEGNVPERGIFFNFDNVAFVLNVLDVLAGEDRLLDVRTRRPRHRTLTLIEKRTKKAKDDAAEEREKAVKKAEEREKKAQETMDKRLAELDKREGINELQRLIEKALAAQALRERFNEDVTEIKEERDAAVNKIKTRLKEDTDRVQNWFRFWAMIVPPIPPLFLALVVFLVRRARESEGVAQTRLQ